MADDKDTRRDAADTDANGDRKAMENQEQSAHFPFLEEDDRKALCSGTLGGDISAGTSSDNG